MKAGTWLALAATMLSACASAPQTFPDGAVKTQGQARAIAERECPFLAGHANDPLHARLDGTDWLIWWGHENPDSGSSIRATIDARSGKERQCVVMGIPTIDVMPDRGYVLMEH